MPKAAGAKAKEGASLRSASTGDETNGMEKACCAKKEVIIAGSAFNAPQTLKLSSVGPKEELLAHGVDVVAGLPASAGI